MNESERRAREALDNPLTRTGIWPSLSADDLRELLRLLDEARADLARVMQERDRAEHDVGRAYIERDDLAAARALREMAG